MDALAAQMAVASALHLTRFPVAKGRTPHDMPAIFISFSTVLLQVCLGRPLDRFGPIRKSSESIFVRKVIEF